MECAGSELDRTLEGRHDWNGDDHLPPKRSERRNSASGESQGGCFLFWRALVQCLSKGSWGSCLVLWSRAVYDFDIGEGAESHEVNELYSRIRTEKEKKRKRKKKSAGNRFTT